MFVCNWGGREFCAVRLTTQGVPCPGEGGSHPFMPWGAMSPPGYNPRVLLCGAVAAITPPKLASARPSPVFSGRIPFGAKESTMDACALVNLRGPVTSAPPNKKLNPFFAADFSHGSIQGTCPVGSTRLIGSPTQYIYAFNPPPPNGLQLSGL